MEQTHLSILDYVIFIVYAFVILGVGLYVSRSKNGIERTAEDYFLASKSLPWWAIGSSLIAANISAEQFIGMSGSGFSVGLAIASYEWMSALTLIIVAKYFLPIFIEKGLYTIPEFIEKRFNTNLKTILAVFWITLFVFVNLTSVLFLGAKALDLIVGTGDGSMIFPCIVAIALFSAAYSIWGGLSAVAWTDVIQVVVLVIGGFVTTYFALDNVTPEGGILHGAKHIYENAGDKFHMIFSKESEFYSQLPGIGVLVGGMWVANLYYWGFNQYIIQRALAAKSLGEAQKGLVFAGIIKIIIPILVVVPGIVVYVMYTQSDGTTVINGIQESFSKVDGTLDVDKSYPWLIRNFVPVGLKGLVLAALTAAIVSSLASMLNSVSTIFTMDIFKAHSKSAPSDKKLVKVGRLSILIALLIAVCIAPALNSLPGMFQYIQEYTGMVSPGILAVFLTGLFWKKTCSKAAIVGVLSSIPLAILFDVASFNIPFLNQMLYILLSTIAIIVFVSHQVGKGRDDEKAIYFKRKLFKTSSTFNIASYCILIVLTFLYVFFW
jgi:SSS family solute:Na+ symporter